MSELSISEQEIANREHVAPTKTGDNIAAKKVANYGFGADANWARVPLPLIDEAWDYVGFTNADGAGNYQTWTFKNGGSGGTTVRTLAVTYDANSNITSISRS
jgi:hypothetical protein